MKTEGEGDQQIRRPWACGRDGAEKVEETCNPKVVGCVSESGRSRNLNFLYRLVQLNLTPEIEVFYMLF